MAQASDQLPVHSPQQLVRGARIELPYPEGRAAHNYRAGGAQLTAPGLARHMIESADTFVVQYGAQAISVLYLSATPMPPGTRCTLKARLIENAHAMALPEGEVVGGFSGTVAAIAPIVSYDTPYKAGGYEGHQPLSPLSVARIIDKDGNGGGRSFGVDPGVLASIAGVASQETRDVRNVPSAQGLMTATVGATAGLAARNKIQPTQELRDLREYDPGRLQAEIAELADRHRGHGYDTRPKEEASGLPMQVIRNAEGEILMKGRAESVEHLIAIKMEEAATTNDPNKKVVNLAGAQLDERTLGRPLRLEGFEFKNVDMRGANLQGASIKDCKFQNCDMEGISLKNVQMNLCSFNNVNMNRFEGDNKTKFENCAMQNVHMAGASAPGIKFDNIRADKLNIQGADFSGSNWSHVHVENLWARDAKLNGAKVGDFHVKGRECNLDGLKLNNATVHNASFGTPQQGISMRGLEAQNSTWSNVQFNKSDLSGADFTRATFTRVDMSKVVTPMGPMQMREANLTGLTAGPDARLMAYKATHSGITMVPSENFVFNGTGPIERAAKAALSVKSEVANITSADGATTQELEARQAMNIQQQNQMLLKRRQMEMAPSPYNRNKKKDTPW